MKFTQFLLLMEAAKYSTPETTAQANKAIQDIASTLGGKGFKKKINKAPSFTKYIFSKGDREITVDEHSGDEKSILNMYDNQSKKDTDFTDFVWDFGSNESHLKNTSAIVSYLKKV